MANTVSAAKNARKAQKRHEARLTVKSELRTIRKKALDLAKTSKKPDEVLENALKACKKYAKAASNKFIHHRTASRKISRLMKQVHKLQEVKN